MEEDTENDARTTPDPYTPLLGMTATPSPSPPADGTDGTDGTVDHDPAHPSLPGSSSSPSPGPGLSPNSIDRTLRAQLYTSHFLSAWNARLFEFGAVLFLADLFPGTLLPVSVYALVRSAAAIAFAHPMGRWIDTGDRLAVVRSSIVGQRLAVAVSCVVLGLMERGVGVGDVGGDGSGPGVGYALFGILVLLACGEKLCAVMNLISVERDWVVVITKDDGDARRVMNAQMRRIDLLCKLLGPLVVSVLDATSTRVAIYVTLCMNVLSVPVEYVCIARVYSNVPALRRPQAEAQQGSGVHATPRTPSSGTFFSASLLMRYFKHPASFPSFSLALLYLSVLSFAGQMITFLLSVGYTSLQVGVVRTLATALEVSSTWLAPRIIARVGAARGGLWSLSWLMAWLAAGTAVLFADLNSQHPDRFHTATVLAGCVAMSRPGLWGYDMCAQLIVQEEVEEDYRGSFSTVEAAFQNLFELLSFATTAVFSKPEQFQWPVLISVMAVYTAGGMHASFVRRRRGHLLHPPPCLDHKRRITTADEQPQALSREAQV